MLLPLLRWGGAQRALVVVSGGTGERSCRRRTTHNGKHWMMDDDLPVSGEGAVRSAVFGKMCVSGISCRGGPAAKAGPKTLRPRRESRAKKLSGHAAKAVSRDCSECYWYYGYNG